MTTVGAFAETISEATKALVSLTKQLTNIVGIVQKNIESYCKVKSAWRRRRVADQLLKLSANFADLAFEQELMASEHSGSKDEVVKLVSAELDQYATKVDRIIILVQEQFPELIQSEGMSKALKAALEKKKLVEELRHFLETADKSSPVRDEIGDLMLAFTQLSQQSIQLAQIIRKHAEALSRPPGSGAKLPP